MFHFSLEVPVTSSPFQPEQQHLSVWLCGMSCRHRDNLSALCDLCTRAVCLQRQRSWEVNTRTVGPIWKCISEFVNKQPPVSLEVWPNSKLEFTWAAKAPGALTPHSKPWHNTIHKTRSINLLFYMFLEGVVNPLYVQPLKKRLPHKTYLLSFCFIFIL